MKIFATSGCRLLILLVALTSSMLLYAQKNVEPADREAVTGVPLPAGARVDKRGLSRALADMVMNSAVNRQGMEVDKTSVYVLPPAGYNYDSLSAALTGAGWQLARQQDKDFTLASKGNEQVMVYFKQVKKQTDLYVASCKAGVPVQASTPNQLAQPTPAVQQIQPRGTPVNDPNAMEWIKKTWIKSSSVSAEYGNVVATSLAGYVKSQLEFKPDGSYQFWSKVYGSTMKDIVLIRESGTFTINGNQLTLVPVSNILETWSKKDKNDKFGTLLGTQQLELERTTYVFQHYYFSGIDEWNLLLQVNPPTRRDGPYGKNPAFENTYFYRPAGPTATLIDLPVR